MSQLPPFDHSTLSFISEVCSVLTQTGKPGLDEVTNYQKCLLAHVADLESLDNKLLSMLSEDLVQTYASPVDLTKEKKFIDESHSKYIES